MNRRQKIIVSITGIFIVLLALVGLTYAYFVTQVTGNSNPKSISVSTANLKLEYIDGTAILSSNGPIMPGFTASKEFKVKNSGNVTTSYSVVIDNVNNTFNRTEDWTYKLTLNGEEIASGEVPNRTTYIYNSIEIESEDIHELKLDILYANLTDINQSEDMNKEMSFKVDIRSGITTFDNANEGTLLYLIGRNNLVQDTLTVPGEEASLPTDQNVEIVTDEFAYYNVLPNTTYYTYGTDYEYNSSTNTYDLINPVTCSLEEYYNDIVGNYYTPGSNSKNISQIYYASSVGYMEILGDSDNEHIHILGSFQERIVNVNAEAELAITEDDYGTSLYYRGAVENNYVNYSGMCWRILRVQGDGTIKLVLADEKGLCNADTYSVGKTTTAFISDNNSIKKIIYHELPTYTDPDLADLHYKNIEALKYKNSNIVGELDNWAVSKGLATKDASNTLIFNSEIAQTEWCNDLATNDDLSIGSNDVNFDNTLTLKCKTKGAYNNQAYIHESSIGIITANEAIYAGSSDDNSFGRIYYFLRTNAELDYWTMEPYYSTYPAIINYVNAYGTISQYSIGEGTFAVRPSIALKSTVLATTDSESSYAPGTYQNPYTIN